MKLTAETITDAQIEQVRAHGLAESRAGREAGGYGRMLHGDSIQHHALVALKQRRARAGGSRAISRAWCADVLNILNERAAKDSGS